MTFSRSCQIEGFSVPYIIDHIENHTPLPPMEPEFLPCAYKPKHMVTIMTMTMNNRRAMRLRLCDFHFEYLHRYFEEYQEVKKGESRVLCKFKRNRL